MSDFWAKRLGGGVPAQQPASAPQPSAPASSRPWWDQRAPVQSQPAQQAPAQEAPEGVVYDAAGNAFVIQDGRLVPYNVPETDPSKTKASSARKTERCPECGSGHYETTVKARTRNGTVETKRCFDCGYPVDNSTRGMAGLTGGKPDGHSRQVAHGGIENNFAPQQLAAPAFASEQGGPGR